MLEILARDSRGLKTPQDPRADTIKKNSLSKLIAFVSTFLAVSLFIGIVAYFRYYAPVGSFIHRDLDPEAVVHEVRQLNDLVTVRYVIQKVVGLKEERQPLGSESILLMVQGKVLAGVSLGDVNQYDVQNVHGHTADLRLPPPHLIDAYIDEQNTKVWDRGVTWWTPWVAPDQDLEHKARLLAIDSIRSAAVDSGILNDARRNAQESIRKFLAPFGITTVNFRESKNVS